MNIVTYRSSNAAPGKEFAAYIVLPNGEYLGIMFTASTEEAATAKAKRFMDEEKFKAKFSIADDDNVNAIMEATGVNRGHHLAGKVWMVNVATREKRRVSPEDAAALGEGWVRGGPKS